MKIPNDEQGNMLNVPVGISKKSIQGNGQGNRHNCIARGAISTTTCFKCIKSLILRIM